MSNQSVIVNVPTVLSGEFPEEPKEFFHDKFGAIHTLFLDNEVWFVGKEIAEVLQYEHPSNAISRHVHRDDRVVITKKTMEKMASLQDCPVSGILTFSKLAMGGAQKLTIINESGMYTLVIRSKMKKAEEFTRWITKEVLPSIRKYGAYITPDKLNTITHNPEERDKLIEELNNAQQEIKTLQSQITTLAPLADYTSSVLKSDEAIPTTLIAKEYGMTAQAFNQLLKKLKVIYKKGTRWYAYKKYANTKWFTPQTYHYTDNQGANHSVTSLYWTQYGRHEIQRVLQQAGYVRVA